VRLVSFLKDDKIERLGLWVGGRVYDLARSAGLINEKQYSNILDFLDDGEKGMETGFKVTEAIKDGKIEDFDRNIKPLAPVPHPRSLRDAYAFRQHVETARKNRGLEMIPEFDLFPVFYFSNHNAVFGEGEIVVETDQLERLDFELEAAIVIGKSGKNIKAVDAGRHVAGYTIMNDFSARKMQMEEMKLNLGPAKGKDFGTALGPWLVTPDELLDFRVENDPAGRHDMAMRAYHNGSLVSEGNIKDMNWSFAEIIERCSYGAELYPGDVIGSGTVGTGCFLEINGTKSREAESKGEEYEPVWLKEGDVIELEITGLGQLRNVITNSTSGYSLKTSRGVVK
jgi:fumarylacetoacetate (FAA) hydrolase